MYGFRELSKKEINNIMKDVDKMIYIGNKTKKEKFKQVIHHGIYYPYIISSFGRIFSIYYNCCKYERINLKEMSPSYNKKDSGYLQIGLKYKSTTYICKIHILVDEAFVTNKNPDINNTVNHKNGIKNDNHEWNLEWCTQSENTIHAYKMGLSKQIRGECGNRNKYKEKEIIKVCKLLENNTPLSVITEMTKVSKRTVYHILNKDTWTHISDDYDLSKYNNGKSHDYTNKIHNVCKLLVSNKYTLQEISDMTGITYAMVKNILNKKAYKYISDQYNISVFNNYLTKRK